MPAQLQLDQPRQRGCFLSLLLVQPWDCPSMLGGIWHSHLTLPFTRYADAQWPSRACTLPAVYRTTAFWLHQQWRLWTVSLCNSRQSQKAVRGCGHLPVIICPFTPAHESRSCILGQTQSHWDYGSLDRRFLRSLYVLATASPWAFWASLSISWVWPSLWTAYQCAQTLCMCLIWKWEAVWGGCQPHPWHNHIILTPQVTQSPKIWAK